MLLVIWAHPSLKGKKSIVSSLFLCQRIESSWFVRLSPRLWKKLMRYHGSTVITVYHCDVIARLQRSTELNVPKKQIFFPLIFNDVRCVPLERSYQFLIKCFRSIHLDNTHTHACTSGALWAQRPLTRTICHLLLFPSASCLIVKQNILLVQRQMSVTDENLDNFQKVLKGYIDATSAHSDNLQWVSCLVSCFQAMRDIFVNTVSPSAAGFTFWSPRQCWIRGFNFQLCQNWCQ